jgi:site-specific recombinase XerD
MTTFAPTIETFFTERLITQRQASPRTISAYRDTLRMLLVFAQDRTGKAPSKLDVSHVDATLVSAFLTHLEQERHNSARTRNTRLAAIHSLFRYAAYRHPEHAQSIQRVLAIPSKRHDKRELDYLDSAEADALLAAPDRTTWIGRRDHTLLVLAIQTGLRVSELTHLTIADIELGPGSHVRCHGKGRKDRATPLTRQTVALLRQWMKERSGAPNDPVFPTSRGRLLSVDAVQWLVAKHTKIASQTRPSLTTKIVSPHVLRHTCAMNLLEAGVDSAVIALWLGCAARRSVVSPVQRAEMRGDISGSDG